MEQKISIDDYLSYYFEVLLPNMIYSESRLNQKYTLNKLRYDGEDYINFAFNALCQEVKPSVSNAGYKFNVNVIEREDVGLIQITLPQQKDDIDTIARAYLLFYTYNDDFIIEKYFVIKSFSNGAKFIIYITPQTEPYIMGTLHAKSDDMESEYQKLVIYFYEIILADIKLTKKQTISITKRTLKTGVKTGSILIGIK